MVSIANLNITRRYTSGCCSGLTEVEPWWMMTNRPQNYHQHALDPPQRLSRAASPWLGSPFLLFQPVSAPTDWIEETNQTGFFANWKWWVWQVSKRWFHFLWIYQGYQSDWSWNLAGDRMAMASRPGSREHNIRPAADGERKPCGNLCEKTEVFGNQ